MRASLSHASNPGAGRRELVLEDLEEEPEAAAVAADRLVRQSLEAVGIEAPVAQFGQMK